MKSNKKTAHDNSIKKTWTIIIIALVLIAILGIVIFFLIRKPKVTYEYYINNNKSSVIGNNITNYECSNGTTLDIDKDNNTFKVSNIKKSSLCKIYYEDSAGEMLMNLITGLDETKEKNKVYFDSNGVLRYYGEDPLNYVYFNCTDENDKNTCELWRIVSISKVSDATKDNKYNLKLVKDTPLIAKDTTNNQEISEFSWNNNRGYDYLESSLNGILNTGYYNANGNYIYKNSKEEEVSYDFITNGLKTDKVRNMITSYAWRINATTDNSDAISNWYSDTAHGNMANFKVGLINISDYILSLKDDCKDIAIKEFGTCKSKSYLSKENGFFVLDSYQKDEGFVYRIAGNNAINAIYPTATYNIYPALYLNEDVKIISGDGSINSPYCLSE